MNNLQPILRIRWRLALTAGAALLLAAGCARDLPVLNPTPASTALAAAASSTTAPNDSAVPPEATATAPATETEIPSQTPTATASPTATPSPTPTLHPMMIEAMRQQDYPGSEITIEDTLDPGVNYSRYYVSYESEGLKQYALLTIPFGERPAAGWPVIVFNHGFIPPNVYRTTERYINYVGRLAESGYIVIRPDYRGHDQSEGEASGAYGSPGYVVDVLNAMASVKRLAEADADRIGMWGHSMGGYITLRSMVISQEIKAGVIWAGVVAPYPDPFARGPTQTPPPGATPQPRRGGWRGWLEIYGSPEENPEFWNGVSANSFLTELSGPIQLHHGTADESVPLAASETLYAQLQAAGMPGELYTYDGDNHNLSGYFTTVMNRTIEFFDTYLK
jgi:fermentation-respiration switch protein FrsA (DUF1100 family)